MIRKLQRVKVAYVYHRTFALFMWNILLFLLYLFSFLFLKVSLIITDQLSPLKRNWTLFLKSKLWAVTNSLRTKFWHQNQLVRFSSALNNAWTSIYLINYLCVCLFDCLSVFCLFFICYRYLKNHKFRNKNTKEINVRCLIWFRYGWNFSSIFSSKNKLTSRWVSNWISTT